MLSLSGYGTNSQIYSYAGPSGTEEVKLNFSSYTVATNFGCAGLSEFAPASLTLINNVTLPDGTAYIFKYEPTPGKSGDVTGRVAEIDLPTGGKIQYQYTGTNGGIDCADGTTAGLTRTTADGTWTYTRNSTFTTTTVQDPGGNQTVLQFSQGDEVQRSIYHGTAAPANLLETITTCYNFSSATPCTTPTVSGSSYGGAPLALTVIRQLPSGKSSQTVTYYGLSLSGEGMTQTINLPTEVDAYDFGATVPTQVKKIAYANLGRNILNRPACVQVTAGANSNACGTVTSNTQSLTNYAYDSNGNLVQTSSWVQGSNYLTRSFTFASNGLLQTATDVNSNVTSYTPQDCGPNSTPAYLSTVSSAGLSTNTTWDCNGGVPTQVADANGQLTKYGYDMFWRRISVTDPLGNVTNTAYTPATSTAQATVETYLNFPTSNPTSTLDTLYTLDGLGRLVESQTRTGPGAATFDGAIQYAYGWNSTGSFATQTIPGGTALTTTQLDALGRTVSVTDGGGGYDLYSYANNDVLSVLGPAPSGENVKQSQTQYDGLGRQTSVCNISATVNGATSCNQSNGSYSGVLTTTSYSSQTVSSTRGSQTRSTTVDGLGRVTSSTTPEGGTVTNVYDSYGSGCGSFSKPVTGHLAYSVAANGDFICYEYDALGRIIQEVAGPSSCFGSLVVSGGVQSLAVCSGVVSRLFYYDSTSSGDYYTPPTGSSQNYTAGRLMEATSLNTGALAADEWFSYDKDGHVTDMWELTPHSGGYYHSVATFFANGASNTVQLANPSLYTETFGVDGEGRPYSSKQGSKWIVENVLYNAASQPTGIYLGTPDVDNYYYDPNTGLMEYYEFLVGNSLAYDIGFLSWNANGTVQGLTIADSMNAGGGQTETFTYDDLARLVSDSSGSTWAQTFNYDQYDNVTKSGSSAWAPGYNAANNHYTLAGTSYDNSGNLLADTFHNYTWDGYGKLATVDSSACGTNGECMTYDAFGRAVESSSGAAYTEIWYTQAGKAFMNGTTIKYAYWNTPGGGTLTETGNGTAYYYQHKDWLGRAPIISTLGSTSGTVYGDYAFAPYGEIYNTFGTVALNEENFTGDTQDLGVAKMFHTDNRELNTSEGRWLSPDPAGLAAVDSMNPQTWNRYAYVMNNPLSYVDPTGLACYALEIAISGSCGPFMNNGVNFGGNWNSFDLFLTWPVCENGDCGHNGVTNGLDYILAQQPQTEPPTCYYMLLKPCGPANNGQQQKSPARQQCEAKAQQKYSNALVSAHDSRNAKAIQGIVKSEVLAGGLGCVLGGALGSEFGPPGTAAGCGGGAVSLAVDALPFAVVGNFVWQGFAAWGDIYSAEKQLNEDLNNCANIP